MKKIVLLLLLTIPCLCMGQIEVPMEKQEGGTYLIPCKVNGVPMKFIFDTGASVVNISMTEALFLIKNGHIQKTDIKGTSYAQIANGDIVENTEIILRKIEIGGLVLQDVKASVSHNLTAPLLLGQSAIQKLGTIQLEGNKLVILNGKNAKSDNEAINYYKKGFQQIESENYSEAIKSSEIGLSYTKNSKIRANLFDNMATAYFRLKKLDKAIEYCNKGLEEDLYNPQLGYNLGYYLYTQGKKTLALKAFKQLIDKIPYYKGAYNDILAAGFAYLGELQADEGEFINAENNLLKSIQYEDNSMAHLQLGRVYAIQKDTQKAIEHYEKGVRFEPNRMSNIKRYHELGQCYIMSRNFEGAINAFNRCVSCFAYNKDLIVAAHDKGLDLSSEFIYITAISQRELGRLCIQTGDLDNSLANYEALATLPNALTKLFEAGDYYGMAYDYAELGNKEKAIEIINNGLSNFIDNPDLLFEKVLLTKTDSLLANRDEQIAMLQKIIKQERTFQPRSFDYSDVYHELARAYYLDGQIKESLSYAKKATELNPNNSVFWYYLGETQYFLQNYEESIFALSKCLELDPTDTDALEIRSQSYSAIGKTKEAKADLKNLKKLMSN